MQLSLIGVVLNSLLYHLALKYLPGTLVMILENLSPIYVLICSFILLRTKPKFIEIVSLLISFSGIIFIVLGKDSFVGIQEKYYLGIILGVLTGFTFGHYTFFSAVLVKPLQKEPLRIIQFLFKIFTLSGILSIPFLFFKPIPHSSNQWFWLIEMGVFQSGLAYLFWNYALASLKTNTASILFLLTIVFTTINEVLFLHLHLNIYLVTGGILICISGLLLARLSKKAEPSSIDSA